MSRYDVCVHSSERDMCDKCKIALLESKLAAYEQGAAPSQSTKDMDSARECAELIRDDAHKDRTYCYNTFNEYQIDEAEKIIAAHVAASVERAVKMAVMATEESCRAEVEKLREMVEQIERQLVVVPKTVCGHCKDGLFPAISDRGRSGLYTHRIGPDGHDELCCATFVYTTIESIRALLATSPSADATVSVSEKGAGR